MQGKMKVNPKEKEIARNGIWKKWKMLGMKFARNEFCKETVLQVEVTHL